MPSIQLRSRFRASCPSRTSLRSMKFIGHPPALSDKLGDQLSQSNVRLEVCVELDGGSAIAHCDGGRMSNSDETRREDSLLEVRHFDGLDELHFSPPDCRIRRRSGTEPT